MQAFKRRVKACIAVIPGDGCISPQPQGKGERGMKDLAVSGSADLTPAREANIDLLRIIGCIAVVGLHTLGNVGLLCGFAVPVFLLSSGYLLIRGRPATAKKTAERILRILKIIVLWDLLWLTFPTVFFSPGWSSPWFLTLIRSVKNCLLQNDIWQFWYFGAQMILYLAFWLFSAAKRLDKTGSARTLYIIWGFMAAFGWFLQAYSLLFLHYPAQGSYRQTFRVWTWVQYFTLGGILYRNRDRLIREISMKLNVILLVLFTAIAWAVQYYDGTRLLFNLHAEYYYDDIVVMLWVFLLSLFVLRLRLKHRKLIIETAKLTLGVYIIHPFLLAWYVRFFSVESLADHLALFAALNAASFLLAFLLSRIPILRELVKL